MVVLGRKSDADGVQLDELLGLLLGRSLRLLEAKLVVQIVGRVVELAQKIGWPGRPLDDLENDLELVTGVWCRRHGDDRSPHFSRVACEGLDVRASLDDQHFVHEKNPGTRRKCRVLVDLLDLETLMNLRIGVTRKPPRLLRPYENRTHLARQTFRSSRSSVFSVSGGSEEYASESRSPGQVCPGLPRRRVRKR